METNLPEEILKRLRRVGWTKGAFGSFLGPNCLFGALSYTTDNYWTTAGPFRQIVGSIIAEQYPDRLKLPAWGLVQFNDHPDTTFADIERVLEKAAVKWEEQIDGE